MLSTPAIASVAAVLRGCQDDLIRPTGTGADVAQVGAAVLPVPFPVPVVTATDPVAPRGGEATIETFVAERSRPAQAMGDDPEIARWWQPTVDALIDAVVAELDPLEVELTGPLYVTASATPLDQVVAQPHLDDDQYHPDHGVGLVAIAASHGGPRLARGVLSSSRAMAGAPLGIDMVAAEAWFDRQGDAGAGSGGAVQPTGPDRIVVFPRFGQLHAGPPLAATAGDRGGAETRNLLVLRADTAPRR